MQALDQNNQIQQKRVAIGQIPPKGSRIKINGLIFVVSEVKSRGRLSPKLVTPGNGNEKQ